VTVSDLAIRARAVSKQYRLGPRQHYRSLRDSLAQGVSRAAGALSGRRAASNQEFVWALKDVSFDVHQGDVIGVIGRNGAGKSTLLKILSRITEPTEGHVDIKGRAGALLEVGTGFHPELTGRENIFLNAAILGMTRADVRRKFDEIVAFAEIDQFLDTVVKHYSSGMYMRLAFAVAAHLEPDILIVDEVLAVGDTAFQKKCLGKMGDLAQGGRPVIFVSHNMSAVHLLCNRGIVMHQGRVLLDGSVDDAVREYLKLGTEELGERLWPDGATAPGNDVVRLRAVRTRAHAGAVAAHLGVRDPFIVEIEYQVLADGAQLCACLEFVDAMGAALFGTFDHYIRGPWGEQPAHPVGLFRAVCHVPGDLLNEGDVTLNLRIFSPPAQPNERPHVRELGVLRVGITDRMEPGGARGYFPYKWGAVAVRPSLEWTTEPLGPEPHRQ
jgi:homopolymeric O-antigen transport system ATP-binding protein